MAKEKIKGLTVQIGGDTTSLSKQLKALESKSKATAKELSAINRALKLDPTNTELLTQKQQVLAEQIATTKDKVDILRQAQQQAAEQLKNGDIGEDEYRKLQREVFFAEQSLDKLERQAAETDKALQEAGSAASDFGNDAGDAAQDTNKMGDSVADLGSTMDDLKGKAVLAGKELVTLGAAGKLLQEGASSALDYNSALASIQAQTGASDAEMRSFKTAMDAVYNGGYGENLDEVAATMAQIAQSTRETDPGKLQELAEGALTLSDTFGFDTTESLRAVNMLMDQFGVTADQAYSLVVQGAQKGLNKNGDLMDVINEYSVHYRQMGYSADEFFASLENGAAAGTFSVDKLGDAMKEFGIRTKDTATTTDEAYELLGLDAAKMREQFAAGGESAQAATKTVLTSLMAMSDQVTQNQIGVDLFGTMWEDLGIDGVKALTNVSGSIDMTKDSMTELKEIKYSDVRSEWEQLGRSIQTDLVNPLGQKALPIAKKFVTWTKNNLNTLIPVAKTIGVVFGAMFVVSKVNACISAVKGLVSAYKALRTAVQAANTTMISNPYTALAMAIAAVVAATATMISSMHEAEREHDALVESYRDVARAAEESRQAQIEAARVTNEEYDNYQALWEELQTLVDANGRVKEGGEKRVEFIRSVLADATGQEIELVDGVIQKYDDLTRSISDALEMERARALQSGMQGSYDDAKSTLQGDDQTEGSQLYYERANKAYQDQLREIEAAQVISRRLITERQNLERELSALQERTRYAITPEQQSQLDSLSSRLESVNEQARQAQDRIDDLNYEMEPIAADLESAAYALDVNLATVRNYEELQKAILSGSVDDLTDAMYQASNSILSAEQSSISSLQSQQKTAKDAYDKLVAYSRQTGSKVTDEQLNAALRLKANTAIETYKALLAAGHDTSSAELQQLRQEISADLIELGDYTQTQLAEVFAGFSTSARSYGANYAEGLAQGMESQEERVSNAAKRLANLTTASTRRTLQIASPSKVARSYGGYYSEGFALGITDKTPQAIRNVQRMSDEVIGILNGAELPGGGYSLPAPLVERYSVSGASADLSEMLDKLERIYGAVSSIDPRLVLDDGTLIGRTKDKIDRALGQKQVLSDRGAR
jgi:phage-related minor tail protein